MSEAAKSSGGTAGEPAASTGSTANALESRFTGLRRYNLVAAGVHAVQAVAVVLLSNDFALPVTASYMQGPPGTPPLEPVSLVEIRIAWGVAAFLGLSAIAHLVVASPALFPRYVAGLRQHRNIFRWAEYSVSASIMIVLIAQIVGISDVAALLTIFGVNLSMILFGWLQEQYEEPGSGGWLPFVFGCVAGIVPWVAITIYLLTPGSPVTVEPPGFVYGIFVSLFVLFNIFAVNQWLQYRRVGPWSDYLVGERAYITLSLVAKSLLAWQVFAGTLAS
ncbi:MAG: heliorhodopsin HeR [Micromonosporaceae bacterium]|nr:heliorhodopsin HeR [Micromonosporaceae bacterium]